jgi:hypothetical protein
MTGLDRRTFGALALALAVATGSLARAEESPLTAAPPAATAGPGAPASLPWDSLNAAQQQLLQGQRAGWDTLPAARQRALARGAERWLSMDETARGDARRRFQDFNQKPSDRRALIRRRWLQYQSLDPELQARVRENFRAFRALPPDRRAQLRRQWQTADRAQRMEMLQQLRQQRAQQQGRR